MAKDFRKKTFQKILRGYAPEEVDEYIAYINEEYRKLERKNAETERKLVLALKKLEEQQKSEEQLGQQKIDEAYMQAVHEAEALLAEAETSAAHIREAAADEAEKQLSEAETAAKQILDTAQTDARKARHEAAGIYDAASEMYEEVTSFRDSLFSLYNTHIENIESIAESAKSYIDGVDGKYSEATGVNVSHDDDEPGDDADDADETDRTDESDEEFAEEPFAEEPADEPVQEETAERDVYIDPFEEEADEESMADEADDSVIQIDWKNRRVVNTDEAEDCGDADETRVLDLKTVRNAMDGEADFAEDDSFAFAEEDGYEEICDEADEDDAGVPDESDDFEEPSDFEEIGNAFRDMDSLFTEDKSGQNLSLTDEFDIVFSGADSRKNVEEIRRQPTVPADDPKKTKKHKKF